MNIEVHLCDNDSQSNQADAYSVLEARIQQKEEIDAVEIH